MLKSLFCFCLLNKKHHTCPVCLSKLKDLIDKKCPLVATLCGHVVCLHCAKILAHRTNLITCPICRERTYFNLLSTDLNCIKCNRNLERLVYKCNLYHLRCGHCYCNECHDLLLFKPFSILFECFICRKYTYAFPLYLA
jgi:hypothetical protein